MVRLSAAALDQAIAVAAHGHRAAASDVGVAVALLRAGARGARLNVEINIGSLSDAAYAGAVAADIARLSEQDVARAADAADAGYSAPSVDDVDVDRERPRVAEPGRELDRAARRTRRRGCALPRREIDDVRRP